MFSIFHKSVSRIGMIAVALVCIGSAQVTRAYIPTANTNVQQTCITQDMVFVLTKGGRFQNVTPTLYMYQNQTYCVCDGNALAIVIDEDAQTVCDTDGNQIGYTVKDSDTPH